MKTKTDPGVVLVFLISILIILGLDALTNSIDITKNQWDFIYYIAMSKDGFNAEPLASPFAYRFFTTGLVNLLFRLGLSIESGFRLIAYLGAFTQLTGIFFFVRWATRSARGAWIALFITAFSLFNVKFLLFDPFRPDHLAYALILLQTFFAFERKFAPLLALTLIGSTIREFNLVPLAAYIFMLAREKGIQNIAVRQGFVSALLILPAVLLPRLLIPVTEDFQLIGLTPQKLLNAVILPFIPSFMINFIFSILAYFLPLMLLTNPRSIKAAMNEIPSHQYVYLTAYTALVLILSFFGGTDYNRFASFLFLPQIILIGQLAPNIPYRKFAFVLTCLFIFNRLWAHIPDWDTQSYRDFYGGFALQLNMSTLYRFFELAGFMLIGWLIHKMKFFSREHKTL